MIFQGAAYEVNINIELVDSLNEFLDQWLQNCTDHGQEIA